MGNQTTPKHILQLAEKWQNGTITESEKSIYNEWYHGFKDEDTIVAVETDPTALFIKIQHKIEIDKPIGNKTVSIWRKVAAIAAVFTIIFLAFYHYALKPNIKDTVESKSFNADQITLTLSNGKKINLNNHNKGIVISDKRIAYADGAPLTNLGLEAEEVLPNTELLLSVPRGKQFKILLQDGTKVWLNAESVLKYPIAFTGNQRKVELTGEAFFDVKTNPEVPFVVSTKQYEVKVYGTKFNVNAYDNEPVSATTLVEGKVSIYTSPTTFKPLLPGDQVQISNQINTVKKVKVNTYTSWKDGVFIFEDMELKSIMRQLARWYDIEVDYERIPKLHFTGGISKSASLNEVLNMFERSGKFNFKIINKKISI